MKKEVNYTWRKDEEWFPVPRSAWSRLACCDCGLVHRVLARVTTNRRVFLTAIRDEKETARVRRKFRRKFVKK